MTEATLADRIFNYLDAVAAFSVVNSLAFLAALAEDDVRASIEGEPAFFVGIV